MFSVALSETGVTVTLSRVTSCTRAYPRHNLQVTVHTFVIFVYQGNPRLQLTADHSFVSRSPAFHCISIYRLSYEIRDFFSINLTSLSFRFRSSRGGKTWSIAAGFLFDVRYHR
jgi:hypothetical protein